MENKNLIKELEIQNLDGKAMVSSLVVARKFKKEHYHVLRDLEDLKLRDEFRQSNFGLANYLDKQGKPRPMYYLSRDLTFLGELEKGIAKRMVEEVDKGTHYKEIYKMIKEKVLECVDFFGKRELELPEKKPVPSERWREGAWTRRVVDSSF